MTDTEKLKKVILGFFKAMRKSNANHRKQQESKEWTTLDGKPLNRLIFPEDGGKYDKLSETWPE